MRSRRARWIACVMLCASLALSAFPAAAEAPANAAFQRTWERTDKPVADGMVSRTWMWGPEGRTGAVEEPYVESPGGMRVVQYFDKSRMEITHPDGDQNSIWYVTNGLLVVELVTGRLQRGDTAFEDYSPSQVPVAGDADDTEGPTYSTFNGLLDETAGNALIAVTQVIDRAGNITTDPGKAGYAVGTGNFVAETQHWIADPFWEFMTSDGLVYENGGYITADLFVNPFYATGFPISEPYWARVKVGGTQRDVLMQCFERRCLTYTPGNPEAFIVEMGNVGLHYRTWRYEEIPGGGAAHCPDSPEGVYVWVADLLNDRVQKFDGDGTFVCQWTGDYEGVGDIARPWALAVDPRDNSLWMHAGGWLNHFDRQGRHLSSFGDFNLGFEDIAIDSQGNIVAINLVEAQVEVWSPTGSLVTAWGSAGAASGQFDSAAGIALDNQDNVYVADRNNHRIQKFSSSGEYLMSWGDDALLDFPAAVTVDSAGTVYAGDLSVYTFSQDGSLLDTWEYTDEWAATQDMDAAPDGTIYALDTVHTMVLHFSADGALLGSWGGQGSAPGQFNGHRNIATSTR